MPTTYAIPNGRTVMDATTYTGNGASPRTITNQYGFQPDFVWVKNRTAAGNYHRLQNSVIGANKMLFSNSADSEQTNEINGYLSAFTSSGFTLTAGTNSSSGTNSNGDNFVAWQWQAGQGTTSSNTQGSITSTVSVNQTAGFSIVTWTGTGSGNTTVGHGLGAVPKLYITKNRSSSADWGVFFPDTFTGTATQNKFMYLNTTAAAGNASQSLPTSTVLSLNGGFENASGNNYVAYCWTPIAGFSAFGSFVGNGTTDNAFVYTGFRPRFLMIKASSNVDNWFMFDTARNPANITNNFLCPNLSNAESQDNFFDILSNGFKMRLAGSYTYIYAAFAENPFKYANAR